MDERKIRLEEARQRALIITDRIRARTDEGIRRRVRNFNTPLNFRGRLEDLAIASEAWDYIGKSRIEPRLVFAHPDLLQAQPQASLHYRGIATLSLKRVQLMAGSVKDWEDGTVRRPPSSHK